MDRATGPARRPPGRSRPRARARRSRPGGSGRSPSPCSSISATASVVGSVGRRRPSAGRPRRPPGRRAGPARTGRSERRPRNADLATQPGDRPSRVERPAAGRRPPSRPSGWTMQVDEGLPGDDDHPAAWYVGRPRPSCSLRAAMDRLTDVPEFLDGPLDDPAALAGNLRDLRRVNRWLGGVSLTSAGVAALAAHRRDLTLLDVGTGGADIPVGLLAEAARSGRRLHVVGTDSRPEVLAAAAIAAPAVTAGRGPDARGRRRTLAPLPRRRVRRRPRLDGAPPPRTATRGRPSCARWPGSPASGSSSTTSIGVGWPGSAPGLMSHTLTAQPLHAARRPALGPAGVSARRGPGHRPRRAGSRRSGRSAASSATATPSPRSSRPRWTSWAPAASTVPERGGRHRRRRAGRGGHRDPPRGPRARRRALRTGPDLALARRRRVRLARPRWRRSAGSDSTSRRCGPWPGRSPRCGSRPRPARRSD